MLPYNVKYKRPELTNAIERLPQLKQLDIGAGDESWHIGPDGMWLGDGPISASPFSVDFATGNTTITTAPVGTEFEIMPVIGNGSSAITTGVKGYFRVPVKCEIQSFELVGDVSGSIKIDVWVDTYANFPPTNADTITDGNEPELSSAQKIQDTDLSNWDTVALAAGAWVGINVDSAATITQATLALQCTVVA